VNHIEFPGLGLDFNINRIAVPLPFFGNGIYWYGIIIMTGIIVAMLVCTFEAKRLGENPDNFYDLVFFGLPAAIICARIYYVAFTFKEYADNPMEIFAIWNGGIAIYGAVIGALIMGVLSNGLIIMNVSEWYQMIIKGLVLALAVGFDSIRSKKLNSN